MNISLHKVVAGFSLVLMVSAAQPVKQASYRIPYNGVYFTTDHLGNVFVIKEDNSILKYSNKGKLLTTINNKLLGKLEYMDVSNPFELYLYYKDQNRIVYTDNLLGLRGQTDLNNLEMANITLIARSYDNNIWAWDQNAQQLKKLTKDLKLLSESGNSRMWALGAIEPAFLIDNESMVLMSDPKVGIYVFDAFANYFKTIPVKGVQEFQVNGDKVFYYHDGTMSIYDMKLFTWQHTDSIVAENVRYEPGYQFIQKKDSIYVDQIIR